MLKSYTMSKVTLTFHIEGHVIHIGVDIGCDIALSQYYSLQSKSSLWPGSITLQVSLKSLSTTCSGFLLDPAPSFTQFHSLLHRDLTRKLRKGPSIAPHAHVGFEPPAPSPTVRLEFAISSFGILPLNLPEAASMHRSDRPEIPVKAQSSDTALRRRMRRFELKFNNKQAITFFFLCANGFVLFIVI
jgi:hypothetical protein